MPHTIEHIVFDIGRVLLHWDPELLYRKLIPDDAERAWFFANVCTTEWNLEQDRGRDWTLAEALLIADYPDHADLIRAWRGRWHETVPGAVEGTADILLTLVEQGRDVTLLSNFNQDTYAEVRLRFPELDAPRGRTISGHVGMIKPEPGIYRHHVSAFALNPAATYFIDDSPPNIAAAEAAGWQGHVFTSADALRADLARHGITV
ncbi:MAG: HAD family phosphatase [Pseudomonadota bacterium]